MAAYNGTTWIKEQIDSILDQSGVEVTLFISVDPSSDGTEAWCESYAVTHLRVQLLSAAGPFSGAARNFFRLVRDVDFNGFDFVAFADQDDIWCLNKLARATNVLRSSVYDAYSSNVTAFWPDGRSLLLDKAQPQVAWDFLFEAAGPGCTYVFSRKMADHLKNSISSVWEPLQRVTLHDWYCYAFARSHDYAWFIDPVPSMRYRQHELNLMGANAGVFSFIARYKSIHGGWWFSQIRLIAGLIGKDGDPFVRNWLKLGRWQLLKLALSSGKCRRRLRDKVLFFIVCCTTAIFGSKPS